MLRGHKIALRARSDDDITILHEELHDDVAEYVRSDGRPWRPLPATSEHSPYRVDPKSTGGDPFSVVDLGAGGELAGEAILWGIDEHNRFAHLGMSLRPAFRGRGLGTDVVAVLCHYGFVVRGFHRLQVETLSDNRAMLGAAATNGFQVEGTLRQVAWVSGAFVDEVILGLLAKEWDPAGVVQAAPEGERGGAAQTGV